MPNYTITPPPDDAGSPPPDAGKKYTITPPPSAPSRAEKIGMGALDPVIGLGQLLAHTGISGIPEAMPFGDAPAPPPSIKDIDASVAKRESDYEARRKAAGDTGADWWRMGGQIISPMNLPLMAGGAVGTGAALGTRLGVSALEGGASAAIQPTIAPDFWSDKRKQIALGLGLGAATEGAASTIGRAIAPRLSGDAKTLTDAGVSLTPGQMAGKWLRRPEEAAKSLPVLGSFIRGAEGRGVESFNRAVINQALEPIGASLPKGLRAGHEAIDHAASTISAEYDKLLPTMRFVPDSQFSAEMQNLRSLANEMPPAQATQFDNIIDNRLVKRLGPQGNMDGATLKQVESELGNFSSSYRSSSDAAQRQLASALDETRHLIREALERQNPQAAGQLKNINAAYAMLVRVENAGQRRAGGQGVFTPMDLLQAVKSGDKSIRHRDFAHGDALMQSFAETGQRVLSKDLPDSGTTERGLWDAAIRGLAGLGVAGGAAGAHVAGTGLPMAAGAGAMIGPYTKLGGAALNRYVAPGAARQAIGGAAPGLGLYASPEVSALGIQ